VVWGIWGKDDAVIVGGREGEMGKGEVSCLGEGGMGRELKGGKGGGKRGPDNNNNNNNNTSNTSGHKTK
jgi:hypothetical protein